MKRLMALFLIALLFLSGCKAEINDEVAFAESYIENQQQSEPSSPKEEQEKGEEEKEPAETIVRPVEKDEKFAEKDENPAEQEPSRQEQEKKTNLITIPALDKIYDYDDYVIDPGEKQIDEAAAIVIARQFFLDEYGKENADLFSGVRSYFYEFGKEYWITFYYPMGDGGYIHGPGVTVDISDYGGVKESSGCSGLENFDLNLLDGWSKAELKQKLMKQLTERHGEKATDLTIESVRLGQGEQGITLSITTDALIDHAFSHDGHKSVSFTYCFETDSWEEPVYCL